jgi:hypothetical protein
VFDVTLSAQLSPEARQGFGDSAWFCPHATCPVAYFDAFERTLGAAELAQPIYPKDPDAPICPCFDFRVEDIEADIREGGATRTKAQLARAQSADAQCSTKSPSGQSCVAVVQKCFMQMRAK